MWGWREELGTTSSGFLLYFCVFTLFLYVLDHLGFLSKNSFAAYGNFLDSAFSSNTWAVGEIQAGENLHIQCLGCVKGAEGERIRF